MSPYIAVFGEPMAFTGEDHKLHLQKETPIPMADKVKQIQKTIMVELDKAYKAEQRRYNLRARPTEHHPGDLVLKKNLSNAAEYYVAKLDHKYEQVKIHAKIGSNCYKLSNLEGRVLPGTYSSQQIKA